MAWMGGGTFTIDECIVFWVRRRHLGADTGVALRGKCVPLIIGNGMLGWLVGPLCFVVGDPLAVVIQVSEVKQ